ncbi:COMM domain-containing protein 8 [Xenopus laevis]|uniref:COMM domain-containing protein 8 n=1 Tax=Xenopus laevis TaxID=8355 RepID=A0A8J1MDY8_XENLA|nr:COMM domain-containing protein 8 [Xenopus laevis]
MLGALNYGKAVFHRVHVQPRLQDYGNIWSYQEWLEVLEDSATFFKNSIGTDVNADESTKAMSCGAILLADLTNGKPQLQYNWQLALSSDNLSALQMPLVNLDLDIAKNGSVTPVSVEMNKEELQNLINSLEAAYKVVLQLK